MLEYDAVMMQSLIQRLGIRCLRPRQTQEMGFVMREGGEDALLDAQGGVCARYLLTLSKYRLNAINNCRHFMLHLPPVPTMTGKCQSLIRTGVILNLLNNLLPPPPTGLLV